MGKRARRVVTKGEGVMADAHTSPGLSEQVGRYTSALTRLDGSGRVAFQQRTGSDELAVKWDRMLRAAQVLVHMTTRDGS